MRALVVGGGLAGPVTAMALQRAEIEAVVLERDPAPDPDTGSWLTIATNGVAALAELDAVDALRAQAVPTTHNRMVGATGRELGVVGTGRPLADGTPALSVKRSAAAHALREEAATRGIDLRYGAAAACVTTTPTGASVVLTTGERLDADLVIGADGIRSVVRPAIDPTAPTGRYVGLTNFGGVSRATPLAGRLRPAAWHFVFGRKAFFGALPTPGGDVVWFVNLRREAVSREERDGRPLQEWLTVLRDLAALDTGPMAELIDTGELELVADNTHDLPCVPTWHRHRLALVGDALHAPAPSSGQGASMAFEDAVVLARCLRDEASPQDAFAAYERERRVRVERIVKQGKRSSSSKNPGAISRPLTEAALRMVFRHVVTDRSQEWLLDHRVSLASRDGSSRADARKQG